MTTVLLAGDEVGVTGTRGDEAVDALTELSDGQTRTGQAQRQIQIGERLRFGRSVLAPPPDPVPAEHQPGGLGIRLGAHTEQQFPRLFLRQGGAVNTHRASSPERSDRYSPKESTSEASSSFPLSADASDGRPMTPDSV